MEPENRLPASDAPGLKEGFLVAVTVTNLQEAREARWEARGGKILGKTACGAPGGKESFLGRFIAFWLICPDSGKAPR